MARRWKDHQDVDAAHRLVTSHLRLAAKIAGGYRGYGLPLNELVSEANIGLMQAVERFDPERGFRLATYAMWWIRAAIQEYILHSWSLVRLGTTAQQKKLFFNLRKLKGRLQALEDGDLAPEMVDTIAETLGVSKNDVVMMNRRLAGSDQSLNSPMREEGDSEWQDWLVDGSMGQEERLAETDEHGFRRELLSHALGDLTARERDIVLERRLREEPITLEKLAQRYGISRERVRQIEVSAVSKLRKSVLDGAADRSREAAQRLRLAGQLKDAAA
ncbi:MAG: RNA polymerase sigma factor RpoH [Rhodospirillales bacterium]|nr:RNA polymerase sigma factor RpoH [Rhodospirillales bacterium]